MVVVGQIKGTGYMLLEVGGVESLVRAEKATTTLNILSLINHLN